jgi:hypothetical protein
VKVALPLFREHRIPAMLAEQFFRIMASGKVMITLPLAGISFAKLKVIVYVEFAAASVVFVCIPNIITSSLALNPTAPTLYKYPFLYTPTVISPVPLVDVTPLSPLTTTVTFTGFANATFVLLSCIVLGMLSIVVWLETVLLRVTVELLKREVSLGRRMTMVSPLEKTLGVEKLKDRLKMVLRTKVDRLVSGKVLGRVDWRVVEERSSWLNELSKETMEMLSEG